MSSYTPTAEHLRAAKGNFHTGLFNSVGNNGLNGPLRPQSSFWHSNGSISLPLVCGIYVSSPHLWHLNAPILTSISPAPSLLGCKIFNSPSRIASGPPL